MQSIIEIASLLTALSVIFGALIGLYKVIKKIDDFKDGINEKIDDFRNDLDSRMNEIDKSQCKNYLVRFLKDIERGEELGEVEIQRAYECYEHYTNDIHGNSYIHDWWTKLMKGGR